jgi:HEAT repeat protein
LPPKDVSPEPLLEAIADEDRETRLSAIRSLTEWLPGERVDTALRALAQSTDGEIREAAADALSSAAERGGEPA